MPHISVRLFLSTWKYQKGILPGGCWPNIGSKSSDRAVIDRTSKQAYKTAFSLLLFVKTECTAAR
jgi:hypothetical protein